MDFLTSTKWGGKATVTVSELQANPEFWRDALYQRKMLILKGLKGLSMDELYDLHQIWGTPWTQEDYKTTTEMCVSQTPGKVLTQYGNVITKEAIGNRQMPWHRDIPWHRDKRYPIRSLYPTVMSNGAGNTGTRFCDCDVLWTRMSDDQREKLKVLLVKIHSWYQVVNKFPNPATKLIPLIEQHPHTKKWSILLNSFGPKDDNLEFSTAITGTWILDAIAREDHVGLQFINELHRLACTPDNIYNHMWEEGDLVLFDNSSGVFHGRDRIDPGTQGDKVERLFWRMNLRHYWQTTSS